MTGTCGAIVFYSFVPFASVSGLDDFPTSVPNFISLASYPFAVYLLFGGVVLILLLLKLRNTFLAAEAAPEARLCYQLSRSQEKKSPGWFPRTTTNPPVSPGVVLNCRKNYEEITVRGK